MKTIGMGNGLQVEFFAYNVADVEFDIIELINTTEQSMMGLIRGNTKL
ncbi:hypothetical protein [Brevibacillus laterosporus]|nr:hypothetical protein [Brevibacillus laterosporus]